MTQQELNAGPAERVLQGNLRSPEFIGTAKKRIRELADIQRELFEILQETNRSWLERMQMEASLISELSDKLAGAHSIPETMTICQEWASRRMDLATEDAKHLLSYTQAFTETGARLLSGG
jgi:hypothetical protein